jgi:diaminopimelate decarboxylase
VTAGFERTNGKLLCDGVSLEDVAQKFGTPLYVYSQALIEAISA